MIVLSRTLIGTAKVHSDYVLLLWPIGIYSVGVRSILKKGFVVVSLNDRELFI